MLDQDRPDLGLEELDRLRVRVGRRRDTGGEQRKGESDSQHGCLCQQSENEPGRNARWDGRLTGGRVPWAPLRSYQRRNRKPSARFGLGRFLEHHSVAHHLLHHKTYESHKTHVGLGHGLGPPATLWLIRVIWASPPARFLELQQFPARPRFNSGIWGADTEGIGLSGCPAFAGHAMRGLTRYAFYGLPAVLLLVNVGCSRSFFRQAADKDVEGVMTEKNQFPDWDVKSWSVYPDPRSRFADCNNPDRPPYPPDQYAHPHSLTQSPAPNVSDGRRAGSSRTAT